MPRLRPNPFMANDKKLGDISDNLIDAIRSKARKSKMKTPEIIAACHMTKTKYYNHIKDMRLMTVAEYFTIARVVGLNEQDIKNILGLKENK